MDIRVDIKYNTLLILLSPFFLLTACELEKEVNIELPDYESRLVVECYLEPGEPFSLLLTRSAAYFDPFPTDNNQFLENLLVGGAAVTIRYKNTTYELENEISFNGATNKLFNYNASQKVPEDYDTDFELHILTAEGETISGKTRILRPVPIDSVIVEFDDSDTLARVLTYFTDIPNEDNYFRRMLHRNNVVDSLRIQDFTTDDRIIEDVVVFGSRYDFQVGDSAINTLFHIDQDYYNFLESLRIAVNSNGNPFGQPSPIITNLEGTANATGIFTGLSYDQKMIVVTE